jgi:hypothetical protein
MAAIAVWMAYFINRRHNATLGARIKTLAPLAHELIVDDQEKVAVVKLEEYWYDENGWDVYLPGGFYRLCLATRGVDDDGLAPVEASQPIQPGRHRIALEQRRDEDVWRLSVACDGYEPLGVEEPTDWDPGVGSSGGSWYSLSEQLAAENLVILFRRRFMRDVGKGQPTTPSGPTEGVLLWVERTTGASRPFARVERRSGREPDAVRRQ